MTWVLLVFLIVVPADVMVDTIAYRDFPTPDSCVQFAARNFSPQDKTVEWMGCVDEAEYRKLWEERTGQAAP